MFKSSLFVCLIVCLLTSKALAQPSSFATITGWTPLVNKAEPNVDPSFGAALFGPNDTLSNRAGATGVNVFGVPMRMIFVQRVTSLGPNQMVLIEKRRSLVVQPGARFTFLTEPIKPGFDAGPHPLHFYSTDVSIFAEGIGPEPSLRTGDAKSAVFKKQ